MIRRVLRRFLQDRRGGVATVTGLSLPVLLVLAVGAIDLSSVNTDRTKARDVADMAALNAAKQRRLFRHAAAGARADPGPEPQDRGRADGGGGRSDRCRPRSRRGEAASGPDEATARHNPPRPGKSHAPIPDAAFRAAVLTGARALTRSAPGQAYAIGRTAGATVTPKVLSLRLRYLLTLRFFHMSESRPIKINVAFRALFAVQLQPGRRRIVSLTQQDTDPPRRPAGHG